MNHKTALPAQDSMHPFSISVDSIRPTSLRGEVGIEAFFKAFFIKFNETARYCPAVWADFKCGIMFLIDELVLQLNKNILLLFSERWSKKSSQSIAWGR